MKFDRNIRLASFPAAEILAGMGLAQVVATLHVFFSNRALYTRMAAAAAAGYLPVPNQEVMPRLLEVGTAFMGGLLFSLTTGAGLAMASVAVAWLWPRTSSPLGTAALSAFGLQAVVLVLMNIRGLDPWVSLYFIVIPPPVYWLTQRFRERIGLRPDRLSLAWRLLPLAAIAVGWSTQYDPHLFIDLRDHLLMSNPAGRAVNDFYYRYTLYPAETFKALDQRLVKTISWPGPAADARHPGLKRELTRADFLPLEDFPAADLRLEIADERLVFKRDTETVKAMDAERFFADPRAAMSALSAASDRWKPFRAFTFFGVLLAFPIALYLLVFACLRLAFGAVAGHKRAEALAAAGCLLIGLGILLYFHSSREAAPPPEEWETALHSPRWQKRAAALRAIHSRNADLLAISGYEPPLHSPWHQERYWLARALGACLDPQASTHLIRLLDDPQLNVRTMALDSLARRKDRIAANQILRRLKRSPEWYFQMYAYQTLKALGWNQTLSH